MLKWEKKTDANMRDTQLRGYISATPEELEGVLGLATVVERETARRWKLVAKGHDGAEHVVEVYDRNWSPKSGVSQTWHVAARTPLDCEQFLRWLALRLGGRDVVPLMWIPPEGVTIYGAPKC